MSNRLLALAVRTCFLFALFIVTLAATDSLPAQEESDAKTPEPDVPATMDNDRLGKLLQKRFENVEGRPGFWLIRLQEKAEETEPEEPVPDDADEPATPEELDEPEDAPEAEDVEVILMVVTDEQANRMRIMTPIRKYDPTNEDDARLAVLLLHANFDRALDAKYAINGGMLWSCFVHPLASLSESDLDNALTQVRTLRKNTGTTYSSTEMIFGGGQDPEEEQQPPRPEI